MNALELVVYGLIGTAVLEQHPLVSTPVLMLRAARPWPGCGPEDFSAIVEAHDWWVKLVHFGVCRRWLCESTLGPPGERKTMRLS